MRRELLEDLRGAQNDTDPNEIIARGCRVGAVSAAAPRVLSRGKFDRRLCVAPIMDLTDKV